MYILSKMYVNNFLLIYAHNNVKDKCILKTVNVLTRYKPSTNCLLALRRNIDLDLRRDSFVLWGCVSLRTAGIVAAVITFPLAIKEVPS